jgi:hypothetical protein
MCLGSTSHNDFHSILHKMGPLLPRSRISCKPSYCSVHIQHNILYIDRSLHLNFCTANPKSCIFPGCWNVSRHCISSKPFHSIGRNLDLRLLPPLSRTIQILIHIHRNSQDKLQLQSLLICSLNQTERIFRLDQSMSRKNISCKHYFSIQRKTDRRPILELTEHRFLKSLVNNLDKKLCKGLW